MYLPLPTESGVHVSGLKCTHRVYVIPSVEEVSSHSQTLPIKDCKNQEPTGIRNIIFMCHGQVGKSHQATLQRGPETWMRVRMLALVRAWRAVSRGLSFLLLKAVPQLVNRGEGAALFPKPRF